jgi:hypothetical protein
VNADTGLLQRLDQRARPWADNLDAIARGIKRADEREYVILSAANYGVSDDLKDADRFCHGAPGLRFEVGRWPATPSFERRRGID